MFLMLALFEPFFYFLGESFGLTYVSATVCSVIISTIPVFATIGCMVNIQGEAQFHKLCRHYSFVSRNNNFHPQQGRKPVIQNIKGLGLMALAVVSAVGYNLTLSRLVGNYSPVHIVNAQNMIGAILFLPLFIILDFQGFHEYPVHLRDVQAYN